MLPCASVSEALCCVNRKQLCLVSAIESCYSPFAGSLFHLLEFSISLMYQHPHCLQRDFTGSCLNVSSHMPFPLLSWTRSIWPHYSVSHSHLLNMPDFCFGVFLVCRNVLAASCRVSFCFNNYKKQKQQQQQKMHSIFKQTVFQAQIIF